MPALGDLEAMLAHEDATAAKLADLELAHGFDTHAIDLKLDEPLHHRLHRIVLADLRLPREE
jgi:hypothetical protein